MAAAAPIELGATTQHLVLHCPSREAVLVVDRLDGRLEERWGAEGAAAVARVDGGWRRCGAVLGVMRWAATQEAFLIVAPPSTPVAVLPPLPTLQVAADSLVPIYRLQSIDMISFITARPMSENELNSTEAGELAKELASGNFYFSPDADLTRSLQSSLATGAAPVGSVRWTRCDDRFFWNRFLVQDFLASPTLALWVAPLFQGSVESREIPAGPSGALRLLLISRKSKRRPCTRYKDRGVDDDGNVANFVETEQLLLQPSGSYTSFVQLRGSVPVFWEQPASQVDLKNINIKSIGNSMGKTGKITLSRSHEASRGAFAKHFATIYELYGLAVLINLLSNKKEGEVLLTQAYQTQLSSHRSPHIKYVAWDFHEYCKQGSFVNVSFLLQKLQPDLDMVAYHAFDSAEGNFSLQRGVFRTNCKDCLDRTNIVQMLVASRSLEMQLRTIDAASLGGVSVDALLPALQRAAESAWAANGDAIARAYAGTGAMKSSIGGGLKALLADGRKSVERYMQATFLDQKKNDALLSLLGMNGKAIALNKDEIDRRKRVLSISHPMTSFNVTIATKNLNGVLPSAFNPQHLLAWLVGTPTPAPPPDLLVIGFQEIIQLTPGKVLSAAASAPAFAEWTAHLTALVDAIRPGGYVLIASAHLVGLAMFVFAAQSLLPHIRDVQRDEVKTGMGGMTGNKGAVGVRCMLHSSSLSFICAHLAAGQKEVLQRDADVATINSIMFRNATAAAHAKSPHRLLFWLGDFNYRIDMNRDEVLGHIAAQRLAPLLQHDELGGRLRPGQPFAGFEEAPITFAPTYKYDPDSDVYDTSAKGRTPAYCDRVLWRSPDEAPPAAKPHLLSYARCELLRLSDHRAVVARMRLPVVLPEEQPSDEFDPRAATMLPSPPSAPVPFKGRVPAATISGTTLPTGDASTPSLVQPPPSRASAPPGAAVAAGGPRGSWKLPDSGGRPAAAAPSVAALQQQQQQHPNGRSGSQPPPSMHRRSTHNLEPDALPSPPSAPPAPLHLTASSPTPFVPFFPPSPTSPPFHPPPPSSSSAPPTPSHYSYVVPPPPQHAAPPPPRYTEVPYSSAPPLALVQHSSSFASFGYQGAASSASPAQQHSSTSFFPPPVPTHRPPSPRPQRDAPPPPIPERRPPSPLPHSSADPTSATSSASFFPPPSPQQNNGGIQLPSPPAAEPSFFPPPVPERRPAYQPPPPAYQRY